MSPENILLIPFGYSGKKMAEIVAKDIQQVFSVPVIVREGHLDLSEFFDSARRQYDGNRILHKIDAVFASDTTKTLGIFNVDLFIPILTYIFGQAFLNGRAGIASVHRLNNEQYGMVRNEGLMLNRFRKEAIHELGHTFGLIHCIDSRCVMHSSTYVEDIDQKGYQLCAKCRMELESSSN